MASAEASQPAIFAGAEGWLAGAPATPQADSAPAISAAAATFASRITQPIVRYRPMTPALESPCV